MRFIFLFIIFFSINFSYFAQDFWSPTANLTPAGDEWIPDITCTPSGTLLAYSHNDGIFRSTNNGDDWIMTWTSSQKVSSLNTSPDGKIFAICNTNSGVYIQMSTDDGLTWNQVYSAVHINNYYSGSQMVFISNSMMLAAISFTLGPTIGDIGVEIVRSENGGLTWQLLYVVSSWGGAENLLKLNDGRILVTTTLSGVSYSNNNGTTWSPLTTFPPYFTNKLAVNSAGHIFLARNTAAANADLLYRSTDNGLSWQGVGLLSGLNGGNVEALYIDNSDKIYISLYTSGPIVKTFYRSADNGASWQQLTNGLPASQLIYSLTGNAQNIIFAGTQSDGIYKGADVVPVELTSFTAQAQNNIIELNWSTASEVNNKGFEVQRKIEGMDYKILKFIPGSGTSAKPVSYNFIDDDITDEKYTYRLKQIDFNGNFEYSPEVEVVTNLAEDFSLEQNFPNPFNPSTKIKYSVPAVTGRQTHPVTLKIFDVLGSEVSVLVNEEKSSGIYEVVFNADNLSGGVYFYKLQTATFSETKKMILTK